MSLFTATAFTQNEKPGLITNGATLLLDAADPRSYVSGSTTWYDLSGNGNNATLNGSLQNNWSSTFGGYFDFPNDYTKFALVTQAPSINNNFLKDFTIEIWWTVDAAAGGNSDNVGPFTKGAGFYANPSVAMLSGRDTGNAFAGVCALYFNGTAYRGGGTDSNSKIWPVGYTGGFATNTWSCTQMVRRNNVLSLYSNLRNCWDLANTVSVSNTANLSIGRGRTDFPPANYPMDGKMMVFAFYNRALNQTERTQNYNVMAQRIGIAEK
jgi:hypothetical protein